MIDHLEIHTRQVDSVIALYQRVLESLGYELMVCGKPPGFETRRFGPFTTGRIRHIVQHCRERAGFTEPVHPHLFRHQMLTYLTSKGLSGAPIQLMFGHETKTKSKIYQHLPLESDEHAHPHTVQAVGV